MTTSFNALTQVDVSDDGGSVMVIMTVVICPMNRTAVSNVDLAYICCLLVDFYRTYMRLHVVRLSMTFRYRDQIGWNSSKITSRPNSLKPDTYYPFERPVQTARSNGECIGLKAHALVDAQHGRSGATGTPQKLRWNRGQLELNYRGYMRAY